MNGGSDDNTTNMTSNRPYLLRAIYDWISDNRLTPYVLVDASAEGVRVPPQAVRNGQVVLNLDMQAVADLDLGDEWVGFKARFSGVSHAVRFPVSAVLAIYAQENGQGMMFAEQGDQTPPPAPTDDSGDGGNRPPADKPAGADEPVKRGGPPHLHVVK